MTVAAFRPYETGSGRLRWERKEGMLEALMDWEEFLWLGEWLEQ